jgi:hypothetical protein
MIGTPLAFVARFVGRTLSYTYEVIDFVPIGRTWPHSRSPSNVSDAGSGCIANDQ